MVRKGASGRYFRNYLGPRSSVLLYGASLRGARAPPPPRTEGWARPVRRTLPGVGAAPQPSLVARACAVSCPRRRSHYSSPPVVSIIVTPSAPGRFQANAGLKKKFGSRDLEFFPKMFPLEPPVRVAFWDDLILKSACFAENQRSHYLTK